jgi:lysozyme family protein
MVASNFEASLKLVLVSEGGNDDDPDDHGGRTSRGITQREYDAWRAEQNLPILDVWQAPQVDIVSIYHDEYWEPYCDLIPIGLDYIYFNNCVLDGPYRATVLLQEALGVTADGRVGPITRQAIASADPKTVIPAISSASAAFYQALHQPKFIKGWLNRVASVEKAALAMLDSDPALAAAS